MYLHILTLIFVVAKILGYLAWSWWIVFLPSIIGFTITLIFIGIAIYCYLLCLET